MSTTEEKILIVGPAWIGDLVMANSLFQLLKQHSNPCTLTVLCPQWSLPLLARMPEVKHAMALPFKHGDFRPCARWHFGAALRTQHFDRAIVLPNSWKSALIPFAAQIPQRSGWLGEARYGLLNDARKLDPQRYPSMISRFNALALPAHAELPAAPTPCLHSDPPQRAQTAEAWHLTNTPYVALCPGAEFGAAKRWPPQQYAELCQRLLQHQILPVILGSPKDTETAQHIASLAQCPTRQVLNLAGKTSLEQAIDILAGAQAVVSNDSGLMHIAAAVGRPVIAIYGPTSPTFTPPTAQTAFVLHTQLACQPCHQRECPLPHDQNHHACMLNISVETVWTHLETILETTLETTLGTNTETITDI